MNMVVVIQPEVSCAETREGIVVFKQRQSPKRMRSHRHVPVSLCAHTGRRTSTFNYDHRLEMLLLDQMLAIDLRPSRAFI